MKKLNAKRLAALAMTLVMLLGVLTATRPTPTMAAATARASPP